MSAQPKETLDQLLRHMGFEPQIEEHQFEDGLTLDFGRLRSALLKSTPPQGGPIPPTPSLSPEDVALSIYFSNQRSSFQGYLIQAVFAVNNPRTARTEATKHSRSAL